MIHKNSGFPSEETVERRKAEYPVGTRIELIEMNDPYAPVPSGTRGTVTHVDDIGKIHMEWDNGRTLGLCPEKDTFKKIN